LTQDVVWRACGRDPPYACCLWVVLVGGALPVACELCLWAGPTKKNKKQKKNGPLARAIGRLV